MNMQSEKRIVVQRGAKLYIDGGHITTTASLWKGVFVIGNKNRNQPFSPTATTTSIDPGVVFLAHGGTISKARTAISTKDPDQSWIDDYYGGLVVSTDGFFENCRRAVEFMSYSRPNNSRFVRTEFTYSGSNSYAGVTIWATDGISFDNCLFDNNKTGIIVYDAGCLIENSTFTDGKRGLEIFATSPSSAGADVDIYNNEFTDIYWEDINAQGSGLPKELNIIDNDFDNSDFSIWLNGPNEGNIETNRFDFAYTGVLTTGTIGSVNKVFCNTFNDNSFGVAAEANCSGLKILNNGFDNSTDDISLWESNSVAGRISSTQGAPGQPADNCFSSANQADINSYGSTVSFNYYVPVLLPPSDCKIPQSTGNFTISSTFPSGTLPCTLPFTGPGNNSQTITALESTSNLSDGESDEILASTENTQSTLRRAQYLGVDAELRGQLLQSSSGQRQLYGLYLHRGEKAAAAAVLNQLRGNFEQSAFVGVQDIKLRFLQHDSAEPFVLSAQQLSFLQNVARTMTEEGAYARGLLSLLTGESFSPTFAGTDSNNFMTAAPTVDAPVSVATSIQVYPTPANEWLNLNNLPEEGQVIIYLTDLHGRTLRSWQETGTISTQLNITGLPNGIFILRVEKITNYCTPNGWLSSNNYTLHRFPLVLVG